MLEKLNKLRQLIGNTPLVSIDKLGYQLFAKLEGYNFTGSAKDRPAMHIIEKGIKSGKIGPDTLIVESSSGNFAIALGTICRMLGLKFTAVIDKNINPVNERLLRVLCHDVKKITIPDETGGHLLNRVKKVKSILANTPDSFWPNQYSNPLNAEAHYQGSGEEICQALDRVDYYFVTVSSGGTVTGTSQRIKKQYPNAKVIAVDSVGSVIFGGPPRPRPIPGMGSSMRPPILDNAIIDEVIYVDEIETVKGCHKLLNDYGLFLGLSLIHI